MTQGRRRKEQRARRAGGQEALGQMFQEAGQGVVPAAGEGQGPGGWHLVSAAWSSVWCPQHKRAWGAADTSSWEGWPSGPRAAEACRARSQRGA